MALYKYFKPISKSCKKCDELELPDPKDSFCSEIPSDVVVKINSTAKKYVHAASHATPSRGPYLKVSSSEKAVVCRYASEHGVARACRHFKEKNLKENTVRDWLKIYKQELEAKLKMAKEGESIIVKEIPTKKCGRPPLLGEKLDKILENLVASLRSRGSPVGSHVVVGLARGVLLKCDQTSLKEFGGSITLTKGWGKQFLRRLGYTKRRGSTKAKILPGNFEEIKDSFLIEVMSVVSMEEIPPELIINWDHTAFKLVPCSNWTMEKKGTKRIEIIAIDDKRQITCVLACTMSGHFLPVRLIYQGTTPKCHPNSVPFPDDWHITHTANHWANEQTTKEYIEKIILPYVIQKRKDLNLDDSHSALVIFDVFKGQCTNDVLKLLEDNNIQFIIVPSNCTDRLQPLDLTVNKSVKTFMRSNFQQWYGNAIYEQLQQGITENVDLRLGVMKPLSARWMIQCFEYLVSHPELAIHGFEEAGIKDACDM